LDTTDLYIQLQETRISLELAQLNLNKLLAGVSPEEIKISETQVENAQNALDIARENLKNSYETAITVLDSSHPQIYNALDFVKEFVREYITIYDQDGRRIMNIRDEIESVEEEAKLYLEIAKMDSTDNENIETALLIMRSSLETTFNNLEAIREITDKSVVYRNKVSVADKASLDTLKANINSALASVIGAQQTISSMKLSLETAQTKLQEAENRLDLTRAETRQVDIDLYETQIKQAQVRVQFYENQLQQSKLISPVDGKIIEIKKRVGELVQSTMQDAVMVILPAVPYEIKVNIYEEDVVGIKVGNPVEITLVALPRETFEGRIVSISPAEKIIDGVVYYESTIGFEGGDEGIKPGMTADVVIQADFKENVLVVPRDVIQNRGDRTIVEVFKNGSIEEKEIEIGIRGGSDDMVEVLFGLEEGEKVIQR
jgi:RND family efflux transporter MFP subunit